MHYITRKERHCNGCNECADCKYDERKQRHYCMHEECIYNQDVGLAWWEEVGGKTLIPEGATE